MKSLPRILVVDDDRDLRSSLEEQFTYEDFLVDTAANGLTALEKITNNEYDIVLLDLKLPKMDGMTVLREMKKMGRLTNVIMLTASNDVATANECVKIGAKDYITKPYDPEELLHIVNRVLSLQASKGGTAE
jgi:DNA-binding response OmpR family regulator